MSSSAGTRHLHMGFDDKESEEFHKDLESISFTNDSITVVELHMMNKKMYYPLTAVSGFTIRAVLYPVSLVKTRLQLQRHRTIYTNMFDAFRKIVTKEGTGGLYRGFWISNLMIFSQVAYVASYEAARTFLMDHTSLTDQRVRSFIAGGCASIVGQTLVVPVDIVAQHLQMLGMGWQQHDEHKPGRTVRKHIELPPLASMTRLNAGRAVVSAVYQQEGVAGFYRGYWASLVTYAPSSAMWWFFYDIYCGMLFTSQN